MWKQIPKLKLYPNFQQTDISATFLCKSAFNYIIIIISPTWFFLHECCRSSSWRLISDQWWINGESTYYNVPVFTSWVATQHTCHFPSVPSPLVKGRTSLLSHYNLYHHISFLSGHPGICSKYSASVVVSSTFSLCFISTFAFLFFISFLFFHCYFWFHFNPKMSQIKSKKTKVTAVFFFFYTN